MCPSLGRCVSVLRTTLIGMTFERRSKADSAASNPLEGSVSQRKRVRMRGGVSVLRATLIRMTFGRRSTVRRDLRGPRSTPADRSSCADSARHPTPSLRWSQIAFGRTDVSTTRTDRRPYVVRTVVSTVGTDVRPYVVRTVVSTVCTDVRPYKSSKG
jgi:hypothetical protein